MEQFSTPMMQQYQEIKSHYTDCLLFFRMGDFYELFLEDAHVGAKVLDITLTGKNVGKNQRIPMAGVPFHAVDSYLTKLVKAGYKVAICEQLTEPDKYGIVERDVVRVVTPGTVLDEKALDQKENNYVVAINIHKNKIGIAAADISTGQLFAGEFTDQHNKEQIISNELSRLNPAECILSVELYNQKEFLKLLQQQKGLNIYCFQDWDIYTNHADKFLKKHFQIASLQSIDLNDKPVAKETAAALLGYLKYTQKDKISHFKTILPLTSDDHIFLDRTTLINLELFSTIKEQDKSGSLVTHIDKTNTAMGGRMIRDWIRKPLINKKNIIQRHEAIDELLKKHKILDHIQRHLKEIIDIERTLSRLSVGIGNARDLVGLKISLQHVVEIKTFLSSFNSSLLKHINTDSFTAIKKIISLLDSHIMDEPPFDTKEGGIIKKNIDKTLDELRASVSGDKFWIESLEKTEKEKTGITSLKIRFNKVFGFYIEISKSYVHLVPSNYQRKQTLVNGERFITPELKEKEEYILMAEEKSKKIEYEIFSKVLTTILEQTTLIQNVAHHIAVLDCLINFAELASKEHYVRPTITDKQDIVIRNGRHPVVEQLLEDTQFVPNSIQLNSQNQLLIITGPNMAGKSVFIRQVALIVLMAQMGSFVPADSANIGIVDRIFVRSGASDMITAGLSTFMVEMVETAQILNQATTNSLIVMDEIGRGTSTYDGISIAWAVAEFLVKNNLKPKTLFATHYHELQSLEEQYPDQIKNYHMAIEEHKGEPIFLHTILPGGASHSYGVAVAKLAGIPEEVTKNAYKILHQLESKHAQVNKDEKLKMKKDNIIEKELMKIDISKITPLEALNILSKLQEACHPELVSGSRDPEINSG